MKKEENKTNKLNKKEKGFLYIYIKKTNKKQNMNKTGHTRF